MPREKDVIKLRYGLDGNEPRTLEEVGRELEVTRERVRQIESSALTKLRKRSRTRRLRELMN
jgi:RNA polymerase sigma factor (sigma-70 family)